jgi:hypothetical protein
LTVVSSENRSFADLKTNKNYMTQTTTASTSRNKTNVLVTTIKTSKISIDRKSTTITSKTQQMYWQQLQRQAKYIFQKINNNNIKNTTNVLATTSKTSKICMLTKNQQQ